MTQSTTIQATLLYKTAPDLPMADLREALRALAARHGLPDTGSIRSDATLLRATALPYEITITPSASALPAASFNGALSANADLGDRGPLSEMIVHHTGHIRMAVRDTGEEVPSWSRRGRVSALILAQDIARLIIAALRPMAIHWHQSNRLDLPVGLDSSDPGTLYIPLCLRAHCVASALNDPDAGNLAQAIQGAEDILDHPLHIMVPGLSIPKTLDLAADFVSQSLNAEIRPQAGRHFSNAVGLSARVVSVEPCREVPAGLYALVGDVPATGPAPRARVASHPPRQAATTVPTPAASIRAAASTPPDAIVKARRITPHQAPRKVVPARVTPSGGSSGGPKASPKATDDAKLRQIFREAPATKRSLF